MTLPGKLPTSRGWIPCYAFCFLLLWVTFATTASPVFCQSLPTLDYSGRAGEKRPELLEQKQVAPPPSVTLPSPPQPPKESIETLIKSVPVRKIAVTGCTVFSPEEIDKLTAPYENRSLSMADLESLRRELTLLYVNKGYINSGAVIPDQTIAEGVVTLQVVEGKLTTINIEGTKWFSDSFLRKRIVLGADVPLNVAPLQDRLQVLQQDQRIQSIHAELRPGTQPGESQLNVRIDEKPPISVWLAFNNYLPQTIGAEQGLVTLAHQNLTGHGDILSFTYGYSEGLHPMIDTWYALPLNAYDTTLMFRYRKNDNTVVDKVFGPLNIVSKTDSYELSLRQPVYRSLTQEFALSLSMEQETSDSYLSGDPFSFYPGDVNGHSTVAPLRFSLDWTYRTQRQVIAARSRQTFGLHALGATYHPQGNLPDGQFFAWLGQVQYARILDFWDTQLLARIDIQRATDSLLPVEQIGVGGRYSVRGYRENFLVRDQAFIASLESRIPLIQNSRWADYVQFCQFLDYGEANNVKLPTPTPSDLSSIGLGLRWGASLLKLPFNIRAEAEIYWGYKLRHVDYYRYEGVQDDGIHYQIAITGFF